MSNIESWSVRSRLVIPLFAVMILGAAGILWALSGMRNEIVNDSLKEERALGDVGRASIQLIAKYREFMIVQRDATRLEIEELKQDIQRPLAAFRRTSHDEPGEGHIASEIEVATQKLIVLGDKTIDLRITALEQIQATEIFDSIFGHHTVAGHANGKSGDAGVAPPIVVLFEAGAAANLFEIVNRYLAEIREYALSPDALMLQGVGKVEQELAQFLQVDNMGDNIDSVNISSETERVRNVQRLLDAGHLIKSTVSEFLTKLEDLDAGEEELLKILSAANVVISRETDNAFDFGFKSVSTVIVLVLALIFLVANGVAKRLEKSLALLGVVADKFGRGDLTARAAIGGDNEVGRLAQGFNQMADALETSTRDREMKSVELQKTQEELLRKSRLAAVGRVTATVSHELRNPLGAIRSATDALNRIAGDADPQMKRALALLERSQNRCNNIISELLDFSRVRELDNRTTQVDEWLETHLEEYTFPPSIALEQNLDAGIEIAFDRDRIERVVRNVIENAWHAMEAEDEKNSGGSNRLTVSTRTSDDRLEISIKDTGPGIPTDNRDKIFEPLFSTKSIGVGLGLPMVRQIMEQHGGGVIINSELDHGTQVTLWFQTDTAQGVV